jgi:DNA-directed RNA polymerase subunit N (RpoN/RPB10)
MMNLVFVILTIGIVIFLYIHDKKTDTIRYELEAYREGVNNAFDVYPKIYANDEEWEDLKKQPHTKTHILFDVGLENECCGKEHIRHIIYTGDKFTDIEIYRCENCGKLLVPVWG